PAHGEPEPRGGLCVAIVPVRDEQNERPRRHARPLSRDPAKVRGGTKAVGPAEALAPARDRHFDGVETARRLRPFARRRGSTVRPPWVFIRARNPWVRRRRIRLG